MIPFTENSLRIRTDKLPQAGLLAAGSHFSVLRLDLMHPEISGNKWFKLQGYLAAAEQAGKRSLLSFGGAYSNHLVALAAAGQAGGFATVGVVRGEKPAVFSPSLRRMQELGMQLRFTDRQSYRQLQLPENREPLEAAYPGALLIPEGGAGKTGVDGAASIMRLPGLNQYSHVCVAVGTGTTLAGLEQESGLHQQLVGVSVLHGTSGYQPLSQDWIAQLKNPERLRIVHGFDQGGYAKHNRQLLDFMNGFYERYQIPSDFVYTGKLFFAISRLTSDGYFPSGSDVLMIHSGGLQGNQSLPIDSLHF